MKFHVFLIFIAFKRNPGKDEKKKIIAYLTVGEKSLLLFIESWAPSNDRESSAWLAAVFERDAPPVGVPAVENFLYFFEKFSENFSKFCHFSAKF